MSAGSCRESEFIFPLSGTQHTAQVKSDSTSPLFQHDDHPSSTRHRFTNEPTAPRSERLLPLPYFSRPSRSSGGVGLRFTTLFSVFPAAPFRTIQPATHKRPEGGGHASKIFALSRPISLSLTRVKTARRVICTLVIT